CDNPDTPPSGEVGAQCAGELRIGAIAWRDFATRYDTSCCDTATLRHIPDVQRREPYGRRKRGCAPRVIETGLARATRIGGFRRPCDRHTQEPPEPRNRRCPGKGREGSGEGRNGRPKTPVPPV